MASRHLVFLDLVLETLARPKTETSRANLRSKFEVQKLSSSKWWSWSFSASNWIHWIQSSKKIEKNSNYLQVFGEEWISFDLQQMVVCELTEKLFAGSTQCVGHTQAGRRNFKLLNFSTSFSCCFSVAASLSRSVLTTPRPYIKW